MPRNTLSEFDKKLREEISNNLKKHTKGLTQSELSDMTGIPTSTLSGYFSKRSTINAGNTQKIADALGINKQDIDPRFKESFTLSHEKKEDETKLVNSMNPSPNNIKNVPSGAKGLEHLKPTSSKNDVLLDLIRTQYGEQAIKLLINFQQLDNTDQVKIIERIDVLLENEKYSNKKELFHA